LAVWPIITAELTVFGVCAFALSSPDRAVSGALARVCAIASAINAVVVPAAALLKFTEMSGSSMVETLGFVPLIVRYTRAGHLWAIHTVLAIALAIACANSKGGRLDAAPGFAIGIAMLVTLTLSGHAIDMGWFSIAIYAVHLAAVAIWIGALVSLIGRFARPIQNDDRAHFDIGRVSRVSSAAVAIIAASGAWTMFRIIGFHPRLLVDSLYGRTLLFKIATAAAVVVMGGYNRFRLVPIAHHESVRATIVRNVSAECVVIAVVIWWSAMLANTPPPH
jgi:putative copper export protein